MSTSMIILIVSLLAIPLVLGTLIWLCGVRYIPHNKVGIVEKLWSGRGSLSKGRLIALGGEAGYQADVLRGGTHWFLFPFQYRIHKVPLVMISEGHIGYVYARDGEPLPPSQTLGRQQECNNFQDAEAFLRRQGQRGRQRAILREGVYAINLAQFVVITEYEVYAGPLSDKKSRSYHRWQSELQDLDGFGPVTIGDAYVQTNLDAKTDMEGQVKLSEHDRVGVVTVHDGPPIETREIIAPEVADAEGGKGHNYFQDPETFLALGGHRGKQLQVITDGTFYINRWFATVEACPKTLVPIGYVGVVVSYHGATGEDMTGDHFRYGMQVDQGHRGVWKHALPPGKYALNPYAMSVEKVPTVNFVLRWITGQAEAHRYDMELKSIEIITADGYEPELPLSLVLHIDYEKAPRVVQRFGDVRRLISQTLDPILSAYFRDVAQSTNMLDLLTHREQIQRTATEELGRRFQAFDITCVAVMIGRPQSNGTQYEAGNDPIEALFDQLRQRRLADEQIATYEKQRMAAITLKELNNAEAEAEKQTQLTQTRVDIEVASNRGEAELAEARCLAERDVVRADGESRARELQGRGDGRAEALVGEGEAARIAQTGLAEASVFLKKIHAYGDPRLFALNLVSEKLSRSAQPLVPSQLLVMGGGGNGNGNGQAEQSATPGGPNNLFSQLLTMLLAEKAGLSFQPESAAVQQLEEYADTMEQQVAEGFVAEELADEVDSKLSTEG